MIDFSLSAFLAQYHLQGLTVGLATFLIIGLFHPVVIKCHYRFGTRCWWWFLLLLVLAAAFAGSLDILMMKTELTLRNPMSLISNLSPKEVDAPLPSNLLSFIPSVWGWKELA